MLHIRQVLASEHSLQFEPQAVQLPESTKNPAVHIEQSLPLAQFKQWLKQSTQADPESYFPLGQEQVFPSNIFPLGQEAGGAHEAESPERVKYWLHARHEDPLVAEQRSQFETVHAGF